MSFLQNLVVAAVWQGLAPDVVWQLTPAELNAYLAPAQAPLTRAEVKDLAQQYETAIGDKNGE